MDDVERCTDHLHTVLFQHTAFRDGNGGIQSRLPPQGWKEGIGPLPGNDLGYRFRRNRLHIRPVRRFGIGHDGCRIAVDEDYLITLFFQGLACLRAGVVEFTGLADNDRPGTDNEDFFQVVPFGHTPHSHSIVLGGFELMS